MITRRYFVYKMYLLSLLEIANFIGSNSPYGPKCWNSVKDRLHMEWNTQVPTVSKYLNYLQMMWKIYFRILLFSFIASDKN